MIICRAVENFRPLRTIQRRILEKNTKKNTWEKYKEEYLNKEQYKEEYMNKEQNKEILEHDKNFRN